MSDDRVFLRDVKPYAVPESLDELQGPATGVVELPLSIYWAPGDHLADVGTADGAWKTYVAALSEGRLEDIIRLVNADRLRQVWGDLLLPRRVVAMWESRFPELNQERARRVRDAIHNGEMEGLKLSAEGQADAQEYI